MKNIAIIFGGKSVEHEVSILTGLHANRHIDGHRVFLVYMTRENEMACGKVLSNVDYYIKKQGRVHECWFMDGILYRRGKFNKIKRVAKIDVVLNCCHGGVGENGELAAMMNVLNIPVTSCGMVSAANLMSKTATRDMLSNFKGKGRVSKFLQPKFGSLGKEDYETNLEEFIRDVVKRIGFPMIVKPDSLGSSIGITIAKNRAELIDAIGLGFALDIKVIVEQYLEDVIEINCSAMSYGGEIKVSGCELVNDSMGEGKIFSFESKYLDGTSGFIKKSGKDEVDYGLGDVYKEIQELTRLAYKVFDANGVVRADFLVLKVDNEYKIYLNEINTVPGFLSYHLWMKVGVPYPMLIDMMMGQAIEKGKEEFTTNYTSDILARNRKLVD